MTLAIWNHTVLCCDTKAELTLVAGYMIIFIHTKAV